VPRKNPIVRYFSRLLDESRAEMASGELLFEQFSSELHGKIALEKDEKLTNRLQEFAKATSRPEVVYTVYLLKSDIPDELVFPGGTIVLTSGLLDAAEGDAQLDFILCRNLMHAVLRHPLKVLKVEGLYAGLLSQIKQRPEKQDADAIRKIARNYLRSLSRMDHKKADLQGILLTASPDKTRMAAIELLKKFTVRIWPALPMDTGDLPGRIAELEKLKLPE
jgi:predicted Zn-dependent protease